MLKMMHNIIFFPFSKKIIFLFYIFERILIYSYYGKRQNNIFPVFEQQKGKPALFNLASEVYQRKNKPCLWAVRPTNGFSGKRN